MFQTLLNFNDLPYFSGKKKLCTHNNNSGKKKSLDALDLLQLECWQTYKAFLNCKICWEGENAFIPNSNILLKGKCSFPDNFLPSYLPIPSALPEGTGWLREVWGRTVGCSYHSPCDSPLSSPPFCSPPLTPTALSGQFSKALLLFFVTDKAAFDNSKA